MTRDAEPAQVRQTVVLCVVVDVVDVPYIVAAFTGYPWVGFMPHDPVDVSVRVLLVRLRISGVAVISSDRTIEPRVA